MGLNVFANDSVTTTSNFVQAIDYAVANGVKVLNESFGGNPFPDTALDAVRIADDDAVAAGVTVVVSSGDAGVTSTDGSPATDPNVISVGASTTFRSYRQNTFGGINAMSPNANNNSWIDNNISSLSSGGFSQSGGNTVDLVAPGDLNWTLCSTNTSMYPCFDEHGQPSGIIQEGGTSESSPLTAGAAADVIQAYQSTHGGAYPTPALVKQILMSSATDIAAPAEQQGAGLLNVQKAVQYAATGGLMISPNQLNITRIGGTNPPQTITLMNTGTATQTVKLSTRALTNLVSSPSGSFCLNPTSGTIGCGAPTANTFKIWNGVTEAYQEETFTVPATGTTSRLNFSATYPDTGQSSLLHVALYDPSGAYAGYSLPQGLADYANVQVANPAPGTWTAVFFTQQADSGTQGTIQWEADTWTYGRGGTITPTSLTIKPGHTGTATFTPTDPVHAAGDLAQSIVITRSAGGAGSATTTIPVTVRTLIPGAGNFSGVLTGGNGRGNPSVTNTYVFTVPAGRKDVEASVNIPDNNNGLTAYLIDPQGNAVASSSNVTLDNFPPSTVIATNGLTVYKDNPEAGRWTLVLDWLQPVSGDAISMPFTGSVQFNQVTTSNNLPRGPGDVPMLVQGQTYNYTVSVTNTSSSPEAYFVDPRMSSSSWTDLSDLSGDPTSLSLPLTAFPPIYIVPPNSTEMSTSLNGNGTPVSYDYFPWPGDPDQYVADGTSTPSALYSPSSGELSPGLWSLVPSEIGPYGAGPAPSATASADVQVWTPTFDPTVSSSTDDLWSCVNTGVNCNGGAFVYVNPGDTADIPVSITPNAAPGTKVKGVVNLDDVFQFNVLSPETLYSDGDQLVSIPYVYKVK